jgi:hypothetical protein
VIFGRINFLSKDLPFSPAQKRWQLLITNAWDFVQYRIMSDDIVDGIPVIVTATRLNLTTSDDGVLREWFVDLAADVRRTLDNLQDLKREAYNVGHGIAQAAIDAALSSMQGLRTELSHIVEQ